jgi:hypothetical protein
LLLCIEREAFPKEPRNSLLVVVPDHRSCDGLDDVAGIGSESTISVLS